MYQIGRDYQWKRNVRYVKNHSQLLMQKRNTVVMLVQKRLENQNKICV